MSTYNRRYISMSDSTTVAGKIAILKEFKIKFF